MLISSLRRSVTKTASRPLLSLTCSHRPSQIAPNIRNFVSRRIETKFAANVRNYSEARKPLRVKKPSLIWVRKQTEKRNWKIERRRNTSVQVPDLCSSRGLAGVLGVRTIDVLKVLIKANECPKNSADFLERDLVDFVVSEFGRLPVRGDTTVVERYAKLPPADPSIFPQRTPVVTIMGHIDHGKTSLLDALRNSNIAEHEHGGITQRMAAFGVKLPSGEEITFIDTPGHAAFGRMRLRGANVGDIVVLVVAADTGVQEQTDQALEYIRESGCSMVVAINKCDKKGADPEKVRLQLNSRGYHVAKFGGTILDVEVSALQKRGLTELQEAILYVADELKLTAERVGPAELDILDVQRDDYRGIIANCIVRLGDLKKGDAFVAGTAWGRVKAIYDSNSKIITKALPGMSVSVSGWDEAPEPGDELLVVDEYERAKRIAIDRKTELVNRESDVLFAELQRNDILNREQEQQDRLRAADLGLDPDIYLRHQEKVRADRKVREVSMFLKADGGGSIEAIQDALQAFPTDEVRIRIKRASVGPITEQDVQEAAMISPKIIVVGFNTHVSSKLRELAAKEGVELNTFKIIYSFMDWMRAVLSKRLRPAEVVKSIAKAEVREVFSIKISARVQAQVAGCLVTEGTIKRKLSQLVRGGKVLWEGVPKSLRYVKEEVKEATIGRECGILLSADFSGIEAGDIIQNVEKSFQERQLEMKTPEQLVKAMKEQKSAQQQHVKQ